MIGKRDKIKELLAGDGPRAEVHVKGWVRTKRESKGFSFAEINDGSCLSNIQCILNNDLPNYEQVSRITTGCSIGVKGELVESPGKGQKFEIQVKEFKIYGEADPETYPLQKKRHSFEFLRSIAHLRTRTNSFGAVFRVRSALCYAIHKFFNDKGFIYVHTPIVSTSDCEGAGEMFQVTTLDIDNPPRNEAGQVDFEQDFFGAVAGLTVSGQLEAEVLATSHCDVYTFGPTFRAENSNTSRHLSEFWMVEPEIAFADLEDDMELSEEFLKYIFQYVLDHCQEDMAFFNQWIEKGVIQKLKGIIDSDFTRISYTEAIDRLLRAKKTKFEYPVEWGMDLQSEHERFLTEKIFKKPVIVHDYPKGIKPFYMRVNDDGRTVAAMDVLVPQVGEIIGGSQREERYEILHQRMQELNMPEEDYGWYADLRKYGTVPHAGFGLGFGRIVMYVTGMSNIRDVIPFPRTPGNAQF